MPAPTSAWPRARRAGSAASITRQAVRIGHQRGQHRVIELVAAANGAVGGEQRLAGQGQIADGVENLVAHEFVGEAQAFRIEHAILGDHQRIGERGAERVAGAPQFGDVLHEAEGAGARDLAAEGLRLDVERERLAANERMVEFDFGLDPETVLVRPQLAEARRPCRRAPA